MPPKDKKKEKPEWGFDALETIVLLLFITGFAASVLPAVIRTISTGEIYFYGFRIGDIFVFLKDNAVFLKTLGFSLAGVFAVGTLIFNKKSDHIWREERAKIYPPQKENLNLVAETSSKSRTEEKWEKIVKLSESENTSDWRSAIIEADIMLDDLLKKLQLPGDTIGDKLKAVEKSDFVTIDLAWEAHKARNTIAHQSDILMNKREVRRIISLYEAVFKEFYLI